MKKRILFIDPLPPPIHGSSIISQYIKESKIINDAFDCDYINLSTSRKMDEIGIWNPFKIIRLLSALLKELGLLFTNRYDLCYLAITCHGKGFLKDAPFVLLCKLFRNKIIIHQHNKGMSKYVDRWPYRWLLPMVYKDAKVILLSWRLYSDIEKVVARENIYICPNGIPNIDYKYKERNNSVPRLLFLSNLIPSKGVYILLDALKLLQDRGVSFVCNFVGGETKQIDTKRIGDNIQKRGLSSSVCYLGQIFGEEKRLLYKESDVFVFPTQNECFGLVILEAMQFGLPIVTTDEGGIPEIVNDGESGFICEKSNPPMLADYIESLLKDRELRIRMGKSGADLYQRNYTLEIFENHLLQIFDNTISK